jgi:hypothetical protein
MRIGPLLAHLRELETELAGELRTAAERHRDDHDVYHQCHTFALNAAKRVQKLEPLAQRDGGQSEWSTAIGDGSDDLLAQLRTLYLYAQEVAITWTMAAQVARASRDRDLLMLAMDCQAELEMQAKWFTTRVKTGAPQALTVG